MALDIASYNARLDATRVCAHCPMRGHGTFVGADSANDRAAPQTVLLLGLNPGNEEARIGRPFVGPSGQFLRQQLQKVGIESWCMANSLLCSSSNESAIVQADGARASCRRNLAVIFLTFKPLLIAPCGNGALSLFKTGMNITPATQNVFVSRGPAGKSAPVLVLPIFHPSALIRSGSENSAKYPQFLQRLQKISELAQYAKANGIEETLEYLRSKGEPVRPCFAGK